MFVIVFQQYWLEVGSIHNILAGQNGEAPLVLAAQEGHVGVVEFLLSKGANIDVQVSHVCSSISLCYCIKVEAGRMGRHRWSLLLAKAIWLWWSSCCRRE